MNRKTNTQIIKNVQFEGMRLPFVTFETTNTAGCRSASLRKKHLLTLFHSQ